MAKDTSGFFRYSAENLRKVNALRRAISQPALAQIVPTLTKGQLLFTTAAELHDEPATCYNCKMFNHERSCMEMGAAIHIRKLVYPTEATADAKPIEYWPCCSYHGYGEPNYGPEKFSEQLGDPENMGLIWINAPKVGQEIGGANCGGQSGGDECDYYMTEGSDKRAEPSAFCRVLQEPVAGGDVCAAWDDDDKLTWQKAQSLLKELGDA